MIFGKTKLELKVGVFVFVGLIILASFILMIGKFTTWAHGYKLNVTFNFVNGVKLGAPVRYAGVDVGEVQHIGFVRGDVEGKYKVKLTSWIREDIKIPADSTVWVNTLGLLGEKYLEIMPGKDYEHLLAANDTMVGNDPVAMNEFGETARRIMTQVDEAVKGINEKRGTVGKLLYDDQLYKELNDLVLDLQKHPWKLFWKTK